MVQIIGRDRIHVRFGALSGPQMLTKLNAALVKGGEIVAVEAQLSLTRGSASGHSGGKHQHIRSRPGEPPNQEYGTLGNNIESLNVAPLKVEVASRASYAAYLEYGTSKMAERPYMRPAFAKKRAEVVQLLTKAVKAAAKG